MLNNKIKNLQKEIIEYAAHVENMIGNSVKGLVNRDRDLLTKVIETDEPVCNEYELRIDEDCVKTIAQFQPAAGDLRTILMILKMGNDLERLGDEAVNISKSAIYLVERPHFKIEGVDISQLAKESLGMLKDSITSFIKKDVGLSQDVCRRDDIVDDYRDMTLKRLIKYIGLNPATVEQSLHIMNICRKLERIADLSTNICEDVIFMVDGTVIKHSFDNP